LLVSVMVWCVKLSTFTIHVCVCYRKGTSKKW
jgi:hypothetical protein